MESYLPVTWAAIIGLAVAMYVILDGFDLGVGILFPFAASERERDQMMNSVAPFWDGNETWLVLGGAGMMVAFPLAYSIILPALYLPVMLMLLALVFRGVAFEFRWIGVTSKPHWTFAFAAGSALAAFCQGLILGGLIQGIKVDNGGFAGGVFDWATPFAILCGLGLVAGYGLLGATWLVMKTESRATASQGAACRRARLHGFRKPVDTACLRADRRAVVLLAEFPVCVVGAGRNRAGCIRRVALAREQARCAAIPRSDCIVSARLSRSCDLELPLSRSAVTDDLADGGRSRDPGIHADGHADSAADHFWLYDFRVLGLRRKAARGRGISLKRAH
jgi:hypothetical protein